MRVALKAMAIIGFVLPLAWTSATQGRDVVIGYSGRTIAEMPFAWGSRKGFFKEANLDVKMIYMSTSIAAKGLMSGDVDYSTAMGGALRAAIAGAPVIGIYSMFKAQMYLVAQPRYKQVVDLKGKTVGISVFGGGLRSRRANDSQTSRARSGEASDFVADRRQPHALQRARGRYHRQRDSRAAL